MQFQNMNQRSMYQQGGRSQATEPHMMMMGDYTYEDANKSYTPFYPMNMNQYSETPMMRQSHYMTQHNPHMYSTVNSMHSQNSYTPVQHMQTTQGSYMPQSTYGDFATHTKKPMGYTNNTQNNGGSPYPMHAQYPTYSQPQQSKLNSDMYETATKASPEDFYTLKGNTSSYADSKRGAHERYVHTTTTRQMNRKSTQTFDSFQQSLSDKSSLKNLPIHFQQQHTQAFNQSDMNAHPYPTYSTNTNMGYTQQQPSSMYGTKMNGIKPTNNYASYLPPTIGSFAPSPSYVPQTFASYIPAQPTTPNAWASYLPTAGPSSIVSYLPAAEGIPNTMNMMQSYGTSFLPPTSYTPNPYLSNLMDKGSKPIVVDQRIADSLPVFDLPGKRATRKDTYTQRTTHPTQPMLMSKPNNPTTPTQSKQNLQDPTHRHNQNKSSYEINNSSSSLTPYTQGHGGQSTTGTSNSTQGSSMIRYQQQPDYTHGNQYEQQQPTHTHNSIDDNSESGDESSEEPSEDDASEDSQESQDEYEQTQQQEQEQRYTHTRTHDYSNNNNTHTDHNQPQHSQQTQRQPKQQPTQEQPTQEQQTQQQQTQQPFLRIRDPSTNQMRTAPLRILHRDPRITFCSDLLTPKECQFIIDSYKGKMQSMTDDEDGKEMSGAYSAVIQPGDTPLITAIEKRVAALANMPIEHMEPMVIVNYGKDQFFNRQHDGNMRRVSVLLHLNTIPPSDGGETLFSYMGIKIKSVMGSAVFWKNRLPSGDSDYRVMHDAIPLTKGSKWIINCYFNEEVMRNKH